MEVRAASVTGEIAIAIACEDIDQLVAALTSGNAKIAGGIASSLAPYDTPVQAISMTISEAAKVSLSVDWELGELLVTGNLDAGIRTRRRRIARSCAWFALSLRVQSA